MNRLLWLVALSLLAGAIGPAAAQASGKARPNIVLLLADDWGYSDVGAFGSEIATPHLDSLARSGTRFSNFHVTASCSPTRSMLLTGVDNHRNGVGNMRETIPLQHKGKPGYLTVLNQNVVTVATLLQDSGYRTYVAGKWHVGKEPHNLPNQRGFDRSLVLGDSGGDNWQPDKLYLDLTDRVYWYEDGKEVTMPAEFYSSQFYVDKMIDYLRRDQRNEQRTGPENKQPFFSYIAFQANHIPVQAPRAFSDKYKGRYKDGWVALRQQRRDKAVELGLIPKDTKMTTAATTLDWDSLSESEKAYQARRMEIYAGMAEAMDFHVGRLIAELKASGEFDNTVFVFLSDNGAEASDPYAVKLGAWWLDTKYSRDIDKLGDKGAYSIIGPSWSSAAASPLSTYKFYAGEGGVRVPLIIAGPAGIQANQIHQGFTHISDIVPTLLDLAQVARPGTSYRGQPVEAMRGTSLLPVLKGEAQQVHAPEEAIGYELSGNKALFKGDLKLVLNIPPVGDGQWHLYDIRKDPGETEDLQLRMPEAFRTMQKDYDAYAAANGVLAMPDGYEPVRQVMINAAVNVYLPRLGPYLLGALLLLIGLLLYRRRRRQHA